MRKQSGFTKVELLITTTLIGLITAVAVPTYIGWLPDYRLRSATHDLFSNFQKTKLTAVKQNLNTVVCFDGNGYVMFVDQDTDFEQDGAEVVVAQVAWDGYGSVSANPATMTFDKSSGRPCIAFRPNGIPADHGGGFASGTARLSNTNGKTTKVIISQAGHIRIE